MPGSGTLEAITIAAEKKQVSQEVSQVEAVAGKGLTGDRYFGVHPIKQVTLVEAEALEAILREYSMTMNHAQTMRNLLTRDVPLNHLVGKEFSIGSVRLRGTEMCEPCGYLERQTETGAKAALRHRGGIRAEILEGGTLKPGDPIRF